MKNFITIFNQLLNLIPYSKFQKVVEEYNGDKYTKKFNSFHHFITLFYAQLTEKDSLRDIVNPLNIERGKLQFFSLPDIKRSTLSDANNKFALVFLIGLNSENAKVQLKYIQN